MAYFSEAAPTPVPTIEDEEFWEFCQQKELRFQKCSECGMFRFPPVPACRTCASMSSTWEMPPGQPVLFSFTVIHHAASEAFAVSVPYNIAIAAFPEAQGIRMVSNVVGISDLRIGMALKLIWEMDGNGMSIPRFISAD